MMAPRNSGYIKVSGFAGAIQIRLLPNKPVYPLKLAGINPVGFGVERQSRTPVTMPAAKLRILA
ncbi:hypothetical protein [Rhodococcus qingshengii]|uniref:hypothetical protein n=1 Tax=Rhodococcus qingshengii TaxID=334542 RepID=UPI0027A43120|nr:hypothetical protein PI247_30115 [Rhodococcus qingshengii]